MTPRATLLAVTSAVGFLLARALDGLGLLPGVTESASVRAMALDPVWNTAGLLACIGLGVVAARLLRRAPALSVAVLVGGQVALVMTVEEGGRALSGAAPPEGGETGLWVASAVQAALVVLSVTTALLVTALVMPALAAPGSPERDGKEALSSYRVVLSLAPQGGHSGRGPPVSA